jgi:multidrug efflux pump subunit AcrA (membrane-fusion protein)
MKRAIPLLGLFAVAAVAGWLARGRLTDGFGHSANTSSADKAWVVRGPMEQHVKARGIVKPAPNALLRIGFPTPKDVTRRISRLAVVEGDPVKACDVLAVLDHDDLQATLLQMNAEAEVFERRLKALRTLEPLEVRLAEGVLAERKSQTDHAQRLCERVAKLAGTAATTQEWEIAANDRAVAQAKLEQADTTLQQVRARFRTDIAVLEGQIQQARAAIQNVEAQVRWCTLTCPVDGQVFAVHQRQGELTGNQPNASVLTLLDTRQLQLHMYVDEADFGRIRTGLPVTFRVDAYPGELFRGQILRTLPQPILQENVVYYLVVVEVAEEQRAMLWAEMTAHAHVRAGAKEAALWLPLAAVRSSAGGWFVLRRGASGPVEVPVRVGWKDEGRVEILEGLSEGDEVLLGP